jgi:hypothetical protein
MPPRSASPAFVYSPFVKRLIYNALAAPHLRHALDRLDELEARLVSPRSRFAVPFVFFGKGHYRSIKPRHNSIEIERLYEAVLELRPKRVLEIGTARGGSLYLWAQAAADDATIVSVDLPGGPFGGGYDEHRVPLYERFARPGQTLHLLRADSHRPESVRRVTELVAGGPIDLAFIDGDHTYAGVKQDFEGYGPLVRPGGLIAFHDTQPRRPETGIEVDRLWNEIRADYDSEEIVGPEGSGRRIGIGLLRVGEAGVKPVAA